MAEKGKTTDAKRGGPLVYSGRVMRVFHQEHEISRAIREQIKRARENEEVPDVLQ